MLKVCGETIEGKTCVASGSGNVAIYAIEKLQVLGDKVVACSDSNGMIYWTFEYTEQRLHEIMRRIHRDCYRTAEECGHLGNYVVGANILGFRRVADAMLAFGLV